MSEEYTPSPRTYTRTNFVELLQLITPEVYKTEDLALSGVETNPFSNIINAHVQAANSISTVLPMSSVIGTQVSAINTLEGISQYFVKQNKLTNLNPFQFETKILIPLGQTLSNFDTSAEFQSYLSGTLLPSIVVPTPTDNSVLEANFSTLSSLTNDSLGASSVHEYLADVLGWFYFLNTSANGSLAWEPSGYVTSSLTRLYTGDTLETADGVRGFTEHIWRNYDVCSFFEDSALIPESYVSATSDRLHTYLSGTQKLSNLLSFVDAVYSKLHMDKTDFRVKTAFQDYIDAQTTLEDTVNKGPLQKFQTMMALGMADYTDAVENIGLIYDINQVKDEHLEYIAELIGWRLRGESPAKWRHQLRNAVDIYKKSGTLAAVQTAINTLIVDSVFDVSGQVQELWESYIPFLIWYALGTESEYFQNLETWTKDKAQIAGMERYSTSSLEENLKLVTDFILLDLYKLFPENFIFNNKKWDPPRFYTLDKFGCTEDLYTILGEDGMLPFHLHKPTDKGFQAYKQDAKVFDEEDQFDAALTYGPLGYGVYMAGLNHPGAGNRPIYLSATGDMNFVFNYRGHLNYPVPPFEEVKYFRDSSVTADLVEALVEKLKCFGVREAFADQVGTFIVDEGVTSDTNLGSLNEFLLLFSSCQVAPNYDSVMLSHSNYEKNLLNLWNGKSSHLFIDFDNTDFDFAKTTFEGDSRYALYEAARVGKEFAPGHAIVRTNLNASAEEFAYDYSGVDWDYLGINHDDDRGALGEGTVLANFESSSAKMRILAGGGDQGDLDWQSGRGGLNTFKRNMVDNIADTFAFDLPASTENLNTLVNRKALRRRNYRFTLPKEGYYDRTGFNGPTSWDASTVEHSYVSGIGELTLGYVASAGKFHPVADPVEPTGIWHFCEGLASTRTFSGIDTSTTFPYRGLSSVALNNNSKIPELSASATQYVDRCQTPPVYLVAHSLFEQKARDHAAEAIKVDSSSFDLDGYWKDNIQSYANQAIASGLVINSYDDYINFSFQSGLHKLHRDYYRHLGRHTLSVADMAKTANIFGHVFGKGLYNCDFALAGSAGTTFIASSFADSTSIVTSSTGAFIASDAGDMVVPVTGKFIEGSAFSAEFRNPHILSGVEFVQPSGIPEGSEFRVFKADKSFRTQGGENYLIENTVIKSKSTQGLARIRFDLSAYGDRINHLIKDHKFSLNIRSLVGDEIRNELGGGSVGVWIHTDTLEPTSNLMWSWTPSNKWVLHEESALDTALVLNQLAHIKTFPISSPAEGSKCLHDLLSPNPINNVKLSEVREEYFEDFTVDFDTRNYTIHNNFEYLDIIPVPEKYYKNKDLVHLQEFTPTNYIVEVFFVPNDNSSKYLLIDEVQLTDSTLRDWAAIGTGHGIETNGTPLRRFVAEDKLYLTKEELRQVLKFYNALMGQGTGIYATTLASRDAAITADIMEQSGGSRLNYRLFPEWTIFSKYGTDNQTYESLEFDN